jgi:co-chaperonin GroES (HSP10)
MKNTSGITPLEFNVLVKQDVVETKTRGGLMKPEELVDREKHAQTRGVLVALSPLAFNPDIYPADMERPKPGDKVAFARHAGTFIDGLDGEEYRVVKDKDIVAVIG